MNTATSSNLHSVPLTTQGFAAIKSKLLFLKQQRSQFNEMIKNLSSEQSSNANAEDLTWPSTMERLLNTDQEIERLHSVISKAHIIQKSPSAEVIGLGSNVTLRSGARVIECTLVGSMEANPSLGYISDQSPLGKSLLGQRAGDTISLQTGKQKLQEYEILSIK